MKNLLKILSMTLIFSIINISCGGNENTDDIAGQTTITDIILSSDNYNLLLNTDPNAQDSFTFTVRSNQGDDITEFCAFYLDGELLDSNVFTPSALGSHQVTARYAAIESTPITINVVEVYVQNYKHKVLVEDFTGTWCGWCTRIIYALEVIESQTHDVVAAAIHNVDEFEIPERTVLEQHLQVNNYPYATINRNTVWTPPQNENINQPLNSLQPSSPIGIKISSNLGSNSGTVSFSLNFKEDINQSLSFGVYILENGLVSYQKNYISELYNGVTPHIDNFVHNHVLRGVYGNIISNPLNQSAVADNEISVNNLAVNYTSENIDNLYVVVFIMSENGEVLNTQIAKANTSNDYEFVN
ncbi:MAG: Omp28-related outer membrane protein [Bacteroidota bacterium]|nr:Omp28-related outer membrane protein [Bacteroidota bacterium]